MREENLSLRVTPAVFVNRVVSRKAQSLSDDRRHHDRLSCPRY